MSDDETDYAAAEEQEKVEDPYPLDNVRRKPLHPHHPQLVLRAESPFAHFSRWKEEERQRRKEELRALSQASTRHASPGAGAAGDKNTSLPPLHSRYLEEGLRFRALRQAAKLQREASSAKDTLQRMFRELDQLEAREREREQAYQARAASHLAKPLSEKQKQRLRKHGAKRRSATAML